MGRFLDFVFLLVALFGLMVVQTSGAVILDDLRTEFEEEGIDSEYNQQEVMDDIFKGVTKWAVTIGMLGVIMLVGWREYRRQRFSSIRRRGGI